MPAGRPKGASRGFRARPPAQPPAEAARRTEAGQRGRPKTEHPTGTGKASPAEGPALP